MSHAEPIYSSLATDPVLGEIVELFVDEIPDRIGTLKLQATAKDWDGLGRTAHQLKGALGSHGFHEGTPAAKMLETAVRDELPESRILEALDEMIDLCRRLTAGTPPAANSEKTPSDR